MPLLQMITGAEEAKRTVLARKPLAETTINDAVARKLAAVFGRDLSPMEAVAAIVDDVRRRGDDAVREWTVRIDGVHLGAVEVSKEAISQAYDNVPRRLVDALEAACERIKRFHSLHIPRSWFDFADEGVVG